MKKKLFIALAVVTFSKVSFTQDKVDESKNELTFYYSPFATGFVKDVPMQTFGLSYTRLIKERRFTFELNAGFDNDYLYEDRIINYDGAVTNTYQNANDDISSSDTIIKNGSVQEYQTMLGVSVGYEIYKKSISENLIFSLNGGVGYSLFNESVFERTSVTVIDAQTSEENNATYAYDLKRDHHYASLIVNPSLNYKIPKSNFYLGLELKNTINIKLTSKTNVWESHSGQELFNGLNSIDNNTELDLNNNKKESFYFFEPRLKLSYRF